MRIIAAIQLLILIIAITFAVKYRSIIPDQPIPATTPVPSASPACGKGTTSVLVPDPGSCKVICEIPVVKGQLKNGGPEIYWRQGAVACATRCNGDWEPIVQEWTDTPECGGRLVTPIPTTTPTPTMTRRASKTRKRHEPSFEELFEKHDSTWILE